jgi:hypothetical protein
MRRLRGLFLVFVASASLCSAQNTSTSAAQSNGDKLYDMMVAGFHALGYDSAETAARVNVVIQRAQDQVLDTMLRSALIAGGWVTGFPTYATDTTVRLPDELLANGVHALHFTIGDVSEVQDGSFVAVILSRPIPDTYKFALRATDGSLAGDVFAVRRFPVFDKGNATEATAYEVVVSTKYFHAGRMYLDIYEAGR